MQELSPEGQRILQAVMQELKLEIIRLESRIAKQNQFAARAYLKPHDQAVFEERIG